MKKKLDTYLNNAYIIPVNKGNINDLRRIYGFDKRRR